MWVAGPFEFRMDTSRQDHKFVYLDVWDANSFHKSYPLGSTAFDVSELIPGQPLRLQKNLAMQHQFDLGGKLDFELLFKPLEMCDLGDSFLKNRRAGQYGRCKTSYNLQSRCYFMAQICFPQTGFFIIYLSTPMFLHAPRRAISGFRLVSVFICF